MNEVREKTPWGHLEGGQRQAEGPAKALNCRHAWRVRGAAGSWGWSGVSKAWGDEACGQGGARPGLPAEGVDFTLNDMTAFD